jgi:beta-fructofuranosidase
MSQFGREWLAAALAAIVTGHATAADPPHPDRRSPVHFRPAVGTFSDPVPFFWKGTYHVFYLRGNPGPSVPWEHIASEDLVHWRELPTALVADGPADGPDGQHMFTGSVVENAGTFHAFYTGHNERNPKALQVVLHATSPDLVTWTKHRADLLAPDGKLYANKRMAGFRDPFVYRPTPGGRWNMLLCAETADGHPVTGLYSSADLVKWQPEAPLCGGYDVPPECPDTFALAGRRYLVVSPSPRADRTTNFRSKLLPDGEWTAAPGVPLDTPILYAAKTQFDGKRHVLTGWLRDRDGAKDNGGFLWGGTMSIPRELFAGPAGELLSRPVPEVRVPYAKVYADLAAGLKVANVGPAGELTDAGPWRIDGGRLAGAGETLTRARVSVPANYHLALTVKLTGPQATFALAFRQQPGKDHAKHYRLEVRPAKNEATLAGPGYDYPRPVPFAAGKEIEIEAFVQGGLIECFINGSHAFSDRVYEHLDGALDLFVTGGTAEVSKLVVRTAPLHPAD